jgi:hypothetical protein
MDGDTHVEGAEIVLKADKLATDVYCQIPQWFVSGPNRLNPDNFIIKEEMEHL